MAGNGAEKLSPTSVFADLMEKDAVFSDYMFEKRSKERKEAFQKFKQDEQNSRCEKDG